MTTPKKAGATGSAVAAVGVLAASLAHFGMLGDDVARGTRALLRNVGGVPRGDPDGRRRRPGHH